MGQFGLKKISPITKVQAAIGAVAMLAFFILWLLIAAVGDDFILWIGGKNNLSGWVQAMGAIAAIGVAIWVPYKIEANKVSEQKRNEFEVAAINFSFISSRLKSLMTEVVGVSEVIHRTNSLESHCSKWLAVYIQAFAQCPLPEIRDLENLRHISFSDTRKLLVIVSALKSTNEVLLSTQSKVKLFSDGDEAELRSFSQILSPISNNFKSHKKIFDEIIASFEDEIKSKTNKR